jgi:hypothetical protein
MGKRFPKENHLKLAMHQPGVRASLRTKEGSLWTWSLAPPCHPIVAPRARASKCGAWGR